MKPLAHDRKATQPTAARKNRSSRTQASPLAKIPSTKESSSSRNPVPAPAGTKPASSPGDLYRMYSRFAESKAGKSSSSKLALFPRRLKEIVHQFRQQGYSKLKYESGVHRVATRPPPTEQQGRIPLSAANRSRAHGSRRSDNQDSSQRSALTLVLPPVPASSPSTTPPIQPCRHHAHSTLVVSSKRTIANQNRRPQLWRVLRARLYEQEWKTINPR